MSHVDTLMMHIPLPGVVLERQGAQASDGLVIDIQCIIITTTSVHCRTLTI